MSVIGFTALLFESGFPQSRLKKYKLSYLNSEKNIFAVANNILLALSYRVKFKSAGWRFSVLKISAALVIALILPFICSPII